jgi:hypothetical protein
MLKVHSIKWNQPEETKEKRFSVHQTQAHVFFWALKTLDTNPMNRNLPEEKQEKRASHGTLGFIKLKLFCCFGPILRVHSVK